MLAIESLLSIKLNYNDYINIIICENLKGLSNPIDSELENYWKDLNLQIHGKKSHTPSSIIYDLQANDVIFSPLRLTEEQTYTICLKCNDPLINTEQRLFKDSFVNDAITWEPENIFKQDPSFPFQVIGTFKTESYVGTWDFSLESLDNLLIDVVPKKIDFENDYQIITESITDEICELTTRFGGLNQLNFEENYKISNQYIESIHLGNMIKQICENVDIVMKYPYLQISEYYEKVPIGTQSNLDLSQFISHYSDYNWISGGPLSSIFNGYTPLDIDDTIKKTDCNNIPNQYIKYVLNYCLEIAYDILLKLKKIRIKSRKDLLRITEVESWIENLEERINSPFFSNVNTLSILNSYSSQVLEKRIGYQEIGSIYDKLQISLNVDWNPTWDNSNRYYSRPIYDLYEIWCYFKIKNCLENICGSPINQSIISTSHNRITFNLSKGNSGKLNYNYKSSNITLYYNKEYSPANNYSYTLPFKPDITIKIVSEDGHMELHHFDAKYKIKNTTRKFKEEDIFKMHAYKDGIKHTKTASILYPGEHLEFFSLNSTEFISAIPTRPENLEDSQFLHMLIKDILD